LEKKDQFVQFTKVRRHFEEFWLTHKHFANQLTRKFGSGIKGYERLVELWRSIIELMTKGELPSMIEATLLADNRFSFLTPKEDSKSAKKGKAFDTETKSEAFMKEALGNALTCKICHGYLHANSISFDHVQRKQDGGTGALDNAQMTHPFCNTGVKEMQASVMKATNEYGSEPSH
jgi:hypothetical protein